MRYQVMRSFLVVLLPSIVIFPLIFLGSAPIKGLLFDKSKDAIFGPIETVQPIVIVVFDELPLVSLLNKNLEIDEFSYPNFAALAWESYFFRNATINHTGSPQSVASILTGNYGSLTSYKGAPNNLFNWLGRSYDLVVNENFTNLCPPKFCENRKGPFASRVIGMLMDAGVVYMYIILPDKLTAWLPDIGPRWMNFSESWENSSETNRQNPTRKKDFSWYKNRTDQFEWFLKAVNSNREQQLFFLHIVIPHFPFEYYPSGTKHDLGWPPFTGDIWKPDRDLMLETYKQHLLQVEYVDKMIGQLISRLKEVGLYDKSLLVVTADHGMVFRQGFPSRGILPDWESDVLSVPLFFKLPKQRNGVISDRNVQAIDILPSIAGALGVSVPWRTDGQSFIDGPFVERPEKLAYSLDAKKMFRLPADFLPLLRKAVNRKIAIFGSENDRSKIYKIGPFQKLIGKEIRNLKVTSGNNLKIIINKAEIFNSVKPESGFIPGLIKGKVIRSEDYYSYMMNSLIEHKIPIKVLNGADVEQTFVPENPYLTGFEIMTANYARINTGKIFFEILDKRKKIVYSKSERLENIQDNKWYSIIFPETLYLPGVNTIRIRTDSENPGNAVAVWAIDKDVFVDGHLAINGVEQKNRDLAFKIRDIAFKINEPRKNQFDIAVGINGIIRGTTKTPYNVSGDHKFSILMPESSFRSGKNDIEIFIISESPQGNLELERFQ